MSINQDIRSSRYGNPNNPHALYDFIKPSRNISGSGAPLDSLGEDKWLYIDTASGQQYIKNMGSWSPFVDYSSFAPPPSIPDPIQVNEIQVDTIKGRTSDSIILNAGLIGDINVTLDGSNFMDFNSGNIRIQGNGNLISASDVTGYALFSNNGAGKLINIESNTGKIESTGVQPFNIQNATSGQPIDLTTQGDAGAFVNLKCKGVKYQNGGGFTLAELDDTQQLKIYKNGSGSTEAMYVRGSDSSIFSTVAGIPIKIAHEISSQNIQLSTKSTGKIVFINATKFLNFDAGTGIISNSGTAQPLTVKNETTDQPLNLETTGTTDKININSTLGLDMNTTQITNISAINGGDVINRFGSVSVDAGGVLSYAYCQSAHSFCWGAVGGNTTNEYGTIGGFVVAPADVAGVYIPWAGAINMVSASLSYNAAWTFGAGTAIIDIGYIASNLPMINANFTILTTLNIPTGVNFFQSGLGSNTNVAMPSGRLCARLNVAASSPTSQNAEMVCTIWTN